jgi:hypothetical protein
LFDGASAFAAFERLIAATREMRGAHHCVLLDV